MDRHQDVTALLAHRLKPLSRVAPRDSFASDSYSLEDASPVPLKYAEEYDDRRSTSRRPSHQHPFSSAQTHFAPEDDDNDDESYVAEDVDDSRMSVMGPKIHKNGNAPWEEMDGVAEEPEDYDRPTTPATSIFGIRSKHARKGSASTTSGLRQRSKTVVEALSPVGALKGLGFAVGASSATSSASSSSRNSRNNSLAPSMSKQPRPSFQSQYSSSSANSYYNDDDKRSVNTVVDGYNSYPTSRQRSRSRPRQETTYADGTIPIDLTGRNSTTSASSSSFSEDESPRHPPLPRSNKHPLRIATDVHSSHHSHSDSIVRPEDVFRTSIVSTNSEYGQRLHPYSNVDARAASSSPTSPKAPAGFSSSDWTSSPSPLEPSRSPAAGPGNDSPSYDNWLDSPSGYGRSAAGFFDRSRNGTTPLSNKANNNGRSNTSSSSSRKKPPPLTLHPSTSSTSISTLAKGGSGGLIPPPPLPTTPVSPSVASGITRSPTPNSEALYRSGDVATTKPLNITRKPVPQQYQNDSSDYFPGASFPTRSNNNPSTMATTAESCLPFPSTPQQQQQHGDVPPGMLVFPGSPAYGLISLEQAQAKIRASGPAGRSLSGDVKGKKEGLGGFVARMRLGSEDKATTTSGGSVESSVSPVVGSTGSVSHQESSTKTPGSSTATQTASTTATTTNARQPVLRQRKSGFLKIFGGGDKTPSAPMPTNPMPRTGGTTISSPMPVGITDDGLPSPFLAGDAPTRKPMALRDIAGRQGSTSGPSPQIPSRESNPSWSPPQSFQSKPPAAAQVAASSTPASKSFSRQKETGLIVYGGSPNPGDEETGSRGRSGTTSTVHCPQYDIGPKDESIRSDLSTMGGGEDDAEDRKAMLKLRHLSATNFLGTLPPDYLSQPYPGTTTASSSTSSSTLNNSIPFSSTSSEYQFSTSSSSASRPSVSASSDVYASSESSSSIAPSPLPVTPHSGGTGTMAHQQQMSMMSLVSPTPTQSSFLSSPGRTPQQQPFVDIRGGAGPDAGMLSMSSMITSVQEELAATRKQMRQQALEMERMRSELEALRKEKEEMKMMVCRSCGGRDVTPRSNSSESAGEPTEKRAGGVVNRPRAPTGSGGRFGSRMI